MKTSRLVPPRWRSRKRVTGGIVLDGLIGKYRVRVVGRVEQRSLVAASEDYKTLGISLCAKIKVERNNHYILA